MQVTRQRDFRIDTLVKFVKYYKLDQVSSSTDASVSDVSSFEQYCSRLTVLYVFRLVGLV